ncbi:MAG: sulfatase-like hydrolase/transferase, partial [Planctomycetes bacterium]|nr:sulfatase-like hydrolase/transferase [Planctomycetota bacterium]
LEGYYGSADPLRGSKMKSWEGGPRVPCIMRWPGRIAPGQVSDEILTTMDILPTFARLAGTAPTANRIIDGKDIYPFISGQTDKGPHSEYYYYCYTHLQAVRNDRWKLVLPREAKPKWMGWWARHIDEVSEVQLYDLKNDISETTNVAGKHPAIVKRLMALSEKARTDIGDCDRIGKEARFFDPEPKRPDIQRYRSSLAKKPQ